MKTLKYLGKMFEMNKSLRDKQRIINTSEVYHLWNHLMQRYHVIFITNFLDSFVKDDDLKLVLAMGHKVLSNHAKLLERELLKYGIPLPL